MLSFVENGIILICYIQLRLIFKMAALCFVDVSEQEINKTKENAILKNTKHATKFGVTFQRFAVKIVLNIPVTKKPFKFP